MIKKKKIDLIQKTQQQSINQQIKKTIQKAKKLYIFKHRKAIVLNSIKKFQMNQLNSLRISPECTRSIDQLFLTRLTQQQQQQLSNHIVSIMLTPPDNTRISFLTQKFHSIQSQIISVIEQRVRMENSLEIQSIKEKNFQIICKLYDAVKERDFLIDQLAKRNHQLDRSYLMKVAEMEELRVNSLRVTNELEQEKKKHVGIRNDQLNDLNLLGNEIISLKETFRNFFGSGHRPNLDELKLTLDQNQQTISPPQPLALSHSSQQTLSQLLNKQLHLLQCNLSLRLQMLQESAQTNSKYQSIQQQLINRLMDELMRQKQISNQKITSQDSFLSKELIQDSESTQKAYLKSKSDLDDILEMELVKLKEELEKYQKLMKGKDQEVERFVTRIQELDGVVKHQQQKIEELDNQRNKMMKQLQQQSLTHQQSLKQYQLLNQSRIQQLQLKHISQLEQKSTEITNLNQKYQKLQSQLSQTTQQIFTTQSKQLIKAKEEISQLRQANQSLANEKILIKTLNKKLNKEAIEANEERNKIGQERDFAKKERDQLNSELSNLSQMVKKMKEQIFQKDKLFDQRKNDIKEINLQLSLKNDRLIEVQNHLKQLESQLFQSQQVLTKQIASRQQIQFQLTKQYKAKENQLLQTINQLENRLSKNQQKCFSYQQAIKSSTQQIAKSQHEIKRLKLTIQQRENQIQVFTHFTMTQNRLNREDIHESGQISEQTEKLNESTTEQQVLSQTESKLSWKQTRLNQLFNSLQTKQKQLQSNYLLLFQKQSQTQKLFNKRETALSLKQAQLGERQQELKKKLMEYQINFNQTRQMFMKEGEQVELRQLEVESKLSELNQKQLDIAKSYEQLMHLKSHLQEQKVNLQKLQQSIQQSRQQPLSPPPSPLQHALQSPPDFPSLFKLQKSNKVISNTVSESIKGKLSFTQLKEIKIQPELQKQMEGLQKVDQLCRIIADEWMKSQQEKWNLLHYQLDQLAQFVLQAEI